MWVIQGDARSLDYSSNDGMECQDYDRRAQNEYYRILRGSDLVHSWELTWKPKRGPIKTTVPLKWGYMGFHVSLGECMPYIENTVGSARCQIYQSCLAEGSIYPEP